MVFKNSHLRECCPSFTVIINWTISRVKSNLNLTHSQKVIKITFLGLLYFPVIFTLCSVFCYSPPLLKFGQNLQKGYICLDYNKNSKTKCNLCSTEDSFVPAPITPVQWYSSDGLANPKPLNNSDPQGFRGQKGPARGKAHTNDRGNLVQSAGACDGTQDPVPLFCQLTDSLWFRTRAAQER